MTTNKLMVLCDSVLKQPATTCHLS